MAAQDPQEGLPHRDAGIRHCPTTWVVSTVGQLVLVPGLACTLLALPDGDSDQGDITRGLCALRQPVMHMPRKNTKSKREGRNPAVREIWPLWRVLEALLSLLLHTLVHVPHVPLGCTTAGPALWQWMCGKWQEAWGWRHTPAFKVCKQVYF